MAITKQPSTLFLLISLATLSSPINSSNPVDCPGAISVYWGQSSNSEEGTLLETCKSELYDFVILKGVDVYDNGSIPKLNLKGHCGTMMYPCSELQPEIEYCQRNNIKVLLSIKNIIYSGAYYQGFEKEHANYLFKNYLSGQFGPLGTVSLDGVDLSNVQDAPSFKFDTFVRAANQSPSARKIYTHVPVSTVCIQDILNA